MRRTLVAVCGVSLLLAGCGDDGGGSMDTGAATETSMTPTTGSGSGSGSESSMSGATTATDTVAESSGGAECDNTDQAMIDMCIESAMGMPGYCPEVGDCNCMSCSCELAACEADAGCSAIRECAQMTGCLGLDCLEPENCMMVIDDAGGVAGPSGMIALTLSGCVEASMCETQCPGATTGEDSSSGGGSGSGSGG